MKCDIIIPSYNNRDTLVTFVLPALCKQVVPEGWTMRVVVSDDGSTDGTLEVAERWLEASGREYVVLKGAHSGPGGARNRGLDFSDADVVFLLGADIELKEGALSSHLHFHENNSDVNAAALGFVVWDARVEPTCFMEWMVHGGSQNDFDNLLGVVEADPRHYFYGSHISLKREALRNIRFSEEYGGYGWEDLDLGRRMYEKVGLRLYVLHDAVGRHRHFYGAEDIFRRQIVVGRGFDLFSSGYADVNREATRSFWHKLKYGVIKYSGVLFWASLAVRFSENKISTPFLYKFTTDSYFWCGLHRLYPHK